MNPTRKHKLNRLNDVNLRFSSQSVRTVRFLCFFDCNCYGCMRNCFDSHSLWISKRFSNFQNDFCVRVCVLDRTVQEHLGFTSFWFLLLWMKRLDGIRVLPGFLFGDSNRLFDSWPWIFVGKLVSIFSSSFLIRILWNPLLLLPSSSLIHNLWLRWQRAILVACSRWIAGSAIRWWWFAWISENCSNLRHNCADLASVRSCGLNFTVNLWLLVQNWSGLGLDVS